MNNLKIVAFALMFLSICLAGCRAKNKKAATLQSQQSAIDQLTSQQKIAAQTAQTYHAMDNGALLIKLVEQSKLKREAFNSLAYRELKGRTDVNTDSLVSLIRELKNGDALLPLLLLRKLNEKTYAEVPVELRADVLTDALEQSKTFNTWGLPHLYLEDASRAMLECGKSAEPALRRMLSETRPAPVFGSKESMEYLRYKYRLCDYALFFLKKMQGDTTFVMPLSAADRDSLIKEMLK
jgi:hypothetical protein